MGEKIIVCGLNGAGKSTLGYHLAKQLGYQFLDIEDYYFPEKGGEYPYENPRTKEEAVILLRGDLKRYENCVLAAVKGDFGYEVEGLFTRAVLVETEKELRMRRVRERSFARFGDRVLPGGDLWERERRFFEMAAGRTDEEVERWVRGLGVPVRRVDGGRGIEENVGIILRWSEERGGC